MSIAAGIVAMVAVGSVLAAQTPINGRLGAATTSLGAALINFAVGLVLLAVVCALAGELGGFATLADVPAEQLLGGFLGAAYVLSALICVRWIGAGGVVAATVAGQLAASMALDAGGALGLPTRPLGPASLLGAVAVFVGTYLVVAGPAARAAVEQRSPLWPPALMLVGGVALAVQAALNGQLADSVGRLPASVLNFALGSAALAAALVARGEASRLIGVRSVSPLYFLGGALGALNVFATVALVGTIGVGPWTAATVTGQATASLALDRAGLLGLQRRPLAPRRLLGAALLVGGTVLVAI